MAIRVKRANDERPSDRKRARFILQIGDYTFHLDRQEVRVLRSQLNRFKLD